MSRNDGKLSVRQQGAVLVVSLLILLTVTVLGIAGLESTGLQTRMVTNQNDQEKAFQGAEAAVNDGRDWMHGLGATIPVPWTSSAPNDCTSEVQAEQVDEEEGGDGDNGGDGEGGGDGGAQQAQAKCQTVSAGQVLASFGGRDPADGLWWKDSSATSSWWATNGWQYTIGDRSEISTVLNAAESTASGRSGGPAVPRYIVEDMGASGLIEDDLSADTSAMNHGLALYRITGYGEGSRDSSRAMVQSVVSFRP
ncbi:MAG: hypothetical protein KDH88_13145 [Chromatiales bacterium]|nr:hypothetical protein [Chromatiales bacterium]